MKRSAVLLAALCLMSMFGRVYAQTASSTARPIDYRKDGVRFQIMASIRSSAGISMPKSDDHIDANITVKIRISAHAVESNYFGVSSVTFDKPRLKEQGEEKFVWKDERCHQRRGLPKVTVTAVDGSFKTANGSVEIAARPRQLGKLLPGDEILPAVRAGEVGDKNGPLIVFNSKTSSSRLTIAIGIQTIDCSLGVSGQ